MRKKKPCLLMILDGWGVGEENETNALYLAKTPNLDRFVGEYPGTRLTCYGEAVGLPAGIMGNSEVGHMNIGAGRVVFQDLLRIDNSIHDGSFFDNAVLHAVMDKVSSSNGALHLMGLVSDGGVHSQLTHLFALLQMAGMKPVPRVYVHVILDGRDTPPDSGAAYTQQLVDHLEKNRTGQVATVCGRFYAMDRDTRWERTRMAYDMLVSGKGRHETDPVAAIKNAYQRGETDEFVKPVVLVGEGDAPVASVKDGDGIIFFNFRADRARQITRAFTQPAFDGFSRMHRPELCQYVCMTVYDEEFDLPAAFPPVHLKDILGEVVSSSGLRQLRIAETEKYAHVTYFFNGGEENPFPLEDRCLVPSPREVATYDEKPEMSAPDVTREVLARLDADRYDVIVLNFANMDMVGHTGIMEAAVSACEVVDGCVGAVVRSVLDKNGTVLLTADHGNADRMIAENGHPHTAHTLNRVPLILISEDFKHTRLRSQGALCDIAPTILEVMGMAKPDLMTGQSLFVPRQEGD